ncbi:hypothetical protein D3C86_1987110 [compost metagenome]
MAAGWWRLVDIVICALRVHFLTREVETMCNDSGDCINRYVVAGGVGAHHSVVLVRRQRETVNSQRDRQLRVD